MRNHNMLFPQHHRPCSPAVQFLVFLIVAVIVIAGFIAFIFYLINPHPPNFTIKSVSVSPFSISNAQITAAWHILFSLTNPSSKARITCQHVKIFAYYRKTLLSSSTLPSLHFAENFHGSFSANISASSVLIDNNVANAIVMDWKQGVVQFNFKVRARIVFEYFTLMKKRRRITVTCENVKIMFNTTGGSMLNGLKNCKIDL
ncbi:uncharacterized protein LOC114293749 [Camellia sinensis]|uniref:Late embryogenesis abundant protein LEA-2 subgroup domain-containing protein n=1 Tax=Camellia sinensis var. sinensis TaxID=542762 RepID=A0A4S4DIR5_CAMSN|nr:uncharacterized protein LOC114293749 [Camellia sinensis]THG02730.1 hypothetical protein TEA_005421 [Camellia sinensis var. sinensis]